MSRYNNIQKFILFFSVFLFIGFIIYAYIAYVDGVKSKDDGVLGLAVSTILEDDALRYKEIGKDKFNSIESAQKINVDDNAYLIGDSFSYYYKNSDLILNSGIAFLNTKAPMDIFMANEIFRILEPGIYIIDADVRTIAVIEGKLQLTNSDIYAEANQGISYINSEFVLRGYNFENYTAGRMKTLVYTVYKYEKLPENLKALSPEPGFIRF